MVFVVETRNFPGTECVDQIYNTGLYWMSSGAKLQCCVDIHSDVTYFIEGGREHFLSVSEEWYSSISCIKLPLLLYGEHSLYLLWRATD